MRRLFYFLIVLAVVAGGAFAFLRTESISRETLVAKYANGQSEFLDLYEGGAAHYRDEGNLSGPPIVLIHGSNASLHTWEPWVDALRDDYRIVSMDLPGHGLTGAVPGNGYTIDEMVDFVDEVVTTLEVDGFALAGNSMGGNVGWKYALAHPEKLSHLILLDSSGVPDPVETDESYVFRLLRTPVVNQLLIQVTPRDLFADALRSAFFDQAQATDAMIDRYYELGLMEGVREATARRFQNVRGDGTSLLKNIETPTLILWGDKDTLVPVESAYVFEAEIPDATLIIYENIGHLPMEETAARSAQDVREFMEATAPDQDGMQSMVVE
jgi:pimeloyl-ACP methyl ester carboxylesterase